MPQLIRCPSCSSPLHVPDNAAGKQFRCPPCRKPFSVAVGSAQAPARGPARATPTPTPAVCGVSPDAIDGGGGLAREDLVPPPPARAAPGRTPNPLQASGNAGAPATSPSADYPAPPRRAPASPADYPTPSARMPAEVDRAPRPAPEAPAEAKPSPPPRRRAEYPARVLDLADCTEFRQTLQARPPKLVHGTAFLLCALLVSALVWAWLTQADLVVRATGRVRPVSAPKKVFNGARGEVLSATQGGRVVEVHFRPGQEVRQGDLLLRLDTGRLEHEIARRRRTIRTGEEGLARGPRERELARRQYQAARAKALAELAQAEREVRQARERRESDVRLAEVELATARDEELRLRRLYSRAAAAEAELVKAVAHTREAREKLEKARLPVEDDRPEVLRKALVVVEQDYEAKRAEAERNHEAKRGEVEAARIELAALELEMTQAVLRAPVDGVVTSPEVKVGDLLEPGKAVVEVAEQVGFFFEAAVPSEEVGHLRVGMPARVRLDAYDYQRYGTLQGTVTFISPDSAVGEGQKAPSYLVKVALDGDEVGRGELRGKVKLGMAGQVEAVTEQQSLLLILLKKIRKTISLG